MIEQKNAWVRRALLGSATSFVVGLTACGGGGGGDSPSTSRPQNEQAANGATLNLTTDNAREVASLSLSLGDLLLAFAQVETSAAQTALASTNSSWSNSCSNGGTAQFSWVDSSGDGLRGIGDTITVQYNDCAIAQTGSVLTGTVQLSITAKTATSLGLTADHGSGLLLVDASDQSPSHLFGSMNMAWSDDGMTRQLAVASSAREDLKLTTSYLGNNGQTLDDTEQVKGIDLRKTLSHEHARASTKLNFQLQSVYFGGSFNITTPVELASYFDTYPEVGEVNIRGKNSALIKLQANFVSNSDQLDFDFDANGDGVTDDKAYGVWNQLTTGIMWWGEDFGDQSQFAAGSTRNFASNDFRVLSTPYQTGTTGQLPAMAIQFSRELDTTSLPRMQLVRTNYNSGDPYFWGDAVVPVTVQLKGAYLVLTPNQPLQHGLIYVLQSVDANGQTLSNFTYKDKLGNSLTLGNRSFTVDNSLSAAISLPSDAPLLAAGRSLTLSGASSQGTQGIARYQWTQLAGTGITFSDADKATTTISLTAAVSANTSVTVQLQVTDANGQVEYARKVISVVADQANSSILYFRSQAGDYIGQGKAQLILTPTAMVDTTFSRPLLRYSIIAENDDRWSLDLASNSGPLQVGAYENATRASFSGANNGLDLYGAGRGCNKVAGRFDVLDVAYDSSGKLTRLAVDFEQHCEGVTPALFGSLRYNSTLPVRP